MRRVIPQRVFHSRSSHQAYVEHAEKQQHTMVTGPHLDADGHTLIIPSEWYNEVAATFWGQHGFHYNGGTSTWERDTRLPLRKDGKQYTAKAWLTSTQREFYRFWPTLLKECRHCRSRYAPTNEYQIYCTKCTIERQAARRFHDTNQ
jgi:hypothetical protein